MRAHFKPHRFTLLGTGHVKIFFKGTPDVMGKYGECGFSPKRNVKLGREIRPLSLCVASEDHKMEVEAILAEYDLVATIELNADIEGNIAELDAVVNTPGTQRFEKKHRKETRHALAVVAKNIKNAVAEYTS